jgi:hypothetical protein
MHPYATNSEERSKIPFFIAAVAIGLAWLIARSIKDAHLPFWLEVPGTATLYALLLGFFRSYGWRIHTLHRAGLVKVPDLEGEWHGHVTSSFDQLAEKHPVTVRIRQNWTHILIKLEAGHSESTSEVASIYVGDETLLNYQYDNVPNARATATMHAHRGTATLKVSDDFRRLSGDYYSGRDRANHGMIVLTKARR